MNRKNEFGCTQCGEVMIKWQGKCPNCSSWGTVQEVRLGSSSPKGIIDHDNVMVLKKLSEVSTDKVEMMKSMSEFDQVCGGGLTPKGVVMIGGEPGIGKSTLLLQICNALQTDKISIYVTGEEALEQVKLRADRLQVDMSKLACAGAICVETIISTLEQNDPALVVIDSIQTLYSTSCEGSPGTITQMRICSHLLIQWAKRSNAALIIVGHVTKDGSIAGPKVIEHMVDTVLYFEGDRGGSPLRMLRSIKNRFGATDVIGVFEIKENGLIPIHDVSKAFIKQRAINTIGSTILPYIDGNRSILVEIQALIAPSYMQSPKRSVVGWDLSRLNMIMAILETKCKIKLSDKEVYLNVVGGLKINEPAADLAAAMAIMSAHYKAALPLSLVAFGELSLSGEIRSVNKMDTRVQEAIRLGFDKIIMPQTDSVEAAKAGVMMFKRIGDLSNWIQNDMVK